MHRPITGGAKCIVPPNQNFGGAMAHVAPAAAPPCVIGLQSYRIEFGEIKQNKDYYVVQGESRSPMSVPIESPYATL